MDPEDKIGDGCIDRDVRPNADACDGPLVRLCVHHDYVRSKNAEKASRDVGSAEERDRILRLLRECAMEELLEGREEHARLVRTLMTAIRRKGG